jgi:hypothetical protein
MVRFRLDLVMEKDILHYGRFRLDLVMEKDILHYGKI